MKENIINFSYQSLALPSYTYRVLRPIERALEKYALDAFLIDRCAELIWKQKLEGHYDHIPICALDFAVLVQNRDNFFDLLNYLTTWDELNERSTFWSDKFTPFTLQFGPEPFTINLELFQVNADSDHKAFKELYLSNLSTVRLNDDFHFKLCSFEGLIINRILQLNWKNNPLDAYSSLDILIQLIYAFFHHRPSDDEVFYQPYQEKISELKARLQERANVYTISTNKYYWTFYYPEFIGERIRDVLGNNEHLLHRISECLTHSTEANVISFFDNFNYSFPISSDEFISLKEKDVKMILTKIKKGLSQK